jgi:hypothetical protein
LARCRRLTSADFLYICETDSSVVEQVIEPQGSTFWFTVRLGKASHAAASAVSPAPTYRSDTAEAQNKARYTGARILLAEDEPTCSSRRSINPSSPSAS